MTFFDDALPYARRAHEATGVNVSVILAQWADETAFGTSPDWTAKHNPGNVSPGGVVASYPTLDAGVDAWIATMNSADYAAVRAPVGATAQCYALGASPWASGHYEADGPPPGEDLVKIIANYELAVYDGPMASSDFIGTADGVAGEYVVAGDLSTKHALTDPQSAQALIDKGWPQIKLSAVELNSIPTV